MAAEKVGSIYYEMDLDNAKFKKKSDEAGKSAEKLGKQVSQRLGSDVAATQKRITDFTKFALVGMTAAIGLAIGAVGVAAVKSANIMESTLLKYETILGSQEEAVKRTKEIAAFAARTPFETSQIAKGDIILTNFGIRSERTLDIVGNAAAITGDNFGDLALIIGQISQSKDLENIKQLMTRGALSINELREAGIKFAKDGSIVNGVEETYDKVLSILEKKFDGGMEKLSATLPGRLSTLFDNINLKLAEFAEETGLLDILKAVVGEIGRIVEQIDVKAIAQGLKEFAGSMVAAAKGAKEFLDQNPGVLPGIVAALGTAIGVVVVPAIWAWVTAMGALALANAPLLALLGLIGAVVGILSTPDENLTPFTKGIKDAFVQVGQVVESVVRGIANFINDLVARTQTAISDLQLAGLSVERELNRVLNRADQVARIEKEMNKIGNQKYNTGVNAGWVAGPARPADFNPKPAVSGLKTLQTAYNQSFTNITKDTKAFRGTVTDLMNPAKRFSPSIVDWVKRGTGQISDLYEGMYVDIEMMSSKGREGLLNGVQGLNVAQNTTSNTIAPAPVNISVNQQGIIARSRGELRDIAMDIIAAANEELRSRGQAPLTKLNY